MSDLLIIESLSFSAKSGEGLLALEFAVKDSDSRRR